MDKNAIFQAIDDLRHEMEEALMSLISIPAVAPESGGDGEAAKAKRLMQLLENVGFDKIERFDAEDKRVSAGVRPNIIAYVNGQSDEKRLVLVSHLDVVPAGDETAWTISAPFKPTLKDGRIYGRGSEDNGQSLIASLFAVKALKSLGIKPKFTVVLGFVSDEEQGSVFGIQHLLEKGVFKPNDLVVVPDAGSRDGGFLEVAEKSILWFKVQTFGKESHGSLPNLGLNAHRVGMQVALALDEMLHEKYNFRDYRFDVPESTFEPTKKERNVDAVNVVPGEDVFYFDCRVHPNYSLNEVVGDIQSLLSFYEEKTGAKFKLELIQKADSPSLDMENSEVVLILKAAILEARGLEASVGGIGGGSCAAFFRRAGIAAVVWGTIDHALHQPNEYSKVDNLAADAKVFALLAMGIAER
jgi:succinyl-diaminopimelate desuccinylase